LAKISWIARRDRRAQSPPRSGRRSVRSGNVLVSTSQVYSLTSFAVQKGELAMANPLPRPFVAAMCQPRLRSLQHGRACL